MPASSAAGLLALLDEQNDDLKRYALQNLDKVVHEYWYQISGSIASVEALVEDEMFSHRELAALVASKVCVWPRKVQDSRAGMSTCPWSLTKALDRRRFAFTVLFD